MELFILIVIIGSFIVLAVTLFISRQNYKDTTKTRNLFVDQMKEKYPNAVGENKYAIMYNNDEQKALAFEIDSQVVTQKVVYDNIYVSKIILSGNNHLYIGNKKLFCGYSNMSHSAFIVDEKHEEVHFIHYQGFKITDVKFNFNSIINVSVNQNGKTVFSKSTAGTIGRAAAGSIIGGGAGAVVGGLTGNSTQSAKVTKLEVKLLVRDFSDSSFELVLYEGSEVDSNDISFQNLILYANEIKDSISVIIDSIEQQSKLTEQSPSIVPAPSSIAEEIEKFSKLKDQGIISQEEFDSQKAKLLNM